MSKTLIAMMGLPRSGKSTISKELAKSVGAPIVNRDAIRLAVHGQRYQPVAEPLIKTLDLYMIRSLFLAGHEVVICDETNYSEEARAHVSNGDWEVEWYPVLTHPDICKERALATDQSDLIPVIDDMYGRYTRLPVNSRLYYGVKDLPWETHDNYDYAKDPTSKLAWTIR